MSLLSRLAVQAARAYGILSSRSNNISVDYLAVAGGGGGGGGHGGGGGAGGFRNSTATLSTLNTYSIAVGAGGLGGINYSDPTSRGSSGSDSSISGTGLSTITSTGGGGGGGYATNSGIGASGGSGGGGAGQTTSAGGSGTSGQGNSGGSGVTSAYAGAGGGGGASASGGNGSGTVGGTGGAGSSSSISGSSVTYAGGGGGGIGVSATGGTGGAGGGGNGSSNGGTTAGGNGTVNTGGGGGGGGGDFPMNFRGGTGGSGIVIISYTSATPKFVGGTITTSGGKQIHTFTSSGTLSPLTPITASYLVVAGGGGGGVFYGGGGGAGGYQTSSTTLYSGATYVVTVGAGGAISSGTGRGSSGGNSILSGTGITTVTSTGGGGGGGSSGAPQNGGNGGSGGGGGGSGSGGVGGTGISGQGFAGGSTATGYSGGGGGASAVGGNAVASVNAGVGGAGTSSSISGTSTTYAGGGGGNGALGGAGGGGGQGAPNGVPNTGGGGQGDTGSGGSGIVIISYAGSQVFNGGLVTTSGGNTIHTFTSTGALTPLTNNLNNSLRFRSSASAKLTRTPSASNRKTWTWSGWAKLGSVITSGNGGIFGVTGANDTDLFSFRFESNTIKVAGASTLWVQTTQVFRDPSAWYHIVLAVDTTQATAANRIKLYVNGNQVTALSTANYPSQNADLGINRAAQHNIYADYDGTNYLDGYASDINFIDGQALEPYYFGNNDANGVWKPIQYKGTYGTNGFYLTFGNTTSTTTLGYDSSPNGNNWTCNNISLTAGTTYDAMLDVPTNTSATVANYATLNPIQTATANITWANANLQATLGTTGAWRTAINTMAVDSGKWYAEFTLTTSSGAGLSALGILPNTDNYTGSYLPGSTSGSYGYPNDGTKYNNGTNTSYGNTYTTGDIIGIAYDGTNNKIWFSKNGVWQASGDPAAGTNAAFTTNSGVSYYFGVAGVTTTQSVWNCNFGQRPFAYTPPTGFVALNTFNLPTPTILQGNKYMDANLWSGNSSAQTVVNQAQFKPDFVWVKSRTNTQWNNLTDSVRGVTKLLYSNATNAEATNSTALTSFNSNGFSVGDDSGGNGVNTSGQNYVGWQWQAGQGSTSSNTSGSITSTVSANTTAGFSIVTYTGTGANATVGHGLGIAPSMIFFKQRSGGTARAWQVYHISMGNGGGMYLNQTNAYTADSTAFNNTSPTSSVFTIGSSVYPNQNASPYVAYCFAEISGFSKAFSYTGNASSDGPFVYCGFRPKFILIKGTASGRNWVLFDSSRNTYNASSALARLKPNTSDAEDGNEQFDFLSNGFKIRNYTFDGNANGETYIGMAFAEHPFKNSNSR